MTKATAARQAYGLASMIRKELGGDEEAEVWVMILEAMARDLDPKNAHRYPSLYTEAQPSTRVRLRALIDHPGTPQPEREAALAALARIRAADA